MVTDTHMFITRQLQNKTILKIDFDSHLRRCCQRRKKYVLNIVSKTTCNKITDIFHLALLNHTISMTESYIKVGVDRSSSLLGGRYTISYLSVPS